MNAETQQTEFTPPFTVEMREAGIWWDIEQNIQDLNAALNLASSYARHFKNDDRVRVIDSNGKII